MSEPVVIRCRENGPLLVKGPVQIVDHLGNELTPPGNKENIVLCRCGQSRTKPFCDGSHKGCGFQSAAGALDKGTQ
jgi:CDGSH-type Zn-finger protein